MSSKLISTLTLTILFINGFSQYHPISVIKEKMTDGSYSLTAQNHTPVPYYIIIYSTLMENTESSKSLPYCNMIDAFGRISLFKFTQKDKTESWSFSYSTRYMFGNPRARHNSKIKYLIPVKNNTHTSVRKVNNIAKTLNQEIASTWNCFSFTATPGDTVYTSRKGTVLEVKDEYDIGPEIIYFTIKRNYVLIMHKDGTLAWYKLFQKNGIFVKPGDLVQAGDPLGIVGETINGGRGSISLMIYQHNPKRFNLHEDIYDNVSLTGIDRMTDNYEPEKWIYHNPDFITQTGILKLQEGKQYVSNHSLKYVQQEMTKREKKKFGTRN